jgi:hypothetical protein
LHAALAQKPDTTTGDRDSGSCDAAGDLLAM